MKRKSIIRHKTDKNFTIMNNEFLQDERLSLKATGLLSYMLQLPNDWEFSIEDLSKRKSDGKSSVSTAMKELIQMGYCVRKIDRLEDGTIDGYSYTVSDRPIFGSEPKINPSTEKPKTVKPKTENQPLLSTNTSKEVVNTKTEKTRESKAEKTNNSHSGIKEGLLFDLCSKWIEMNPEAKDWKDRRNWGTYKDVKKRFIDGKEFQRALDDKYFDIANIFEKYVSCEKIPDNELSYNEKVAKNNRSIDQIKKDIKVAEYYGNPVYQLNKELVQKYSSIKRK